MYSRMFYSNYVSGENWKMIYYRAPYFYRNVFFLFLFCIHVASRELIRFGITRFYPTRKRIYTKFYGETV